MVGLTADHYFIPNIILKIRILFLPVCNGGNDTKGNDLIAHLAKVLVRSLEVCHLFCAAILSPLKCRRCPKFHTTYRDIAPERRRCPILKDTYRSAGVTAAASGALSRSPGERRAVAAEPACCEAAPLIINDLHTLLVAILQQADCVSN